MRPRPRCRARAAALALLVLCAPGAAQERFKTTGSSKPYVHHLVLRDARDRPIDPADPGAAPYSPLHTCKGCHDYEAIGHGWHFNAASGGRPGRPGEPWILADPRTGTQLPLSYRGWPGTWHPEAAGLDAFHFLVTFGRHLPGGASGYTGADAGAGRFRLSGDLPIDCMACHAAGNTWSHERWAAQVARENLAWAPVAALGLATVEGAAADLPDDAAADASGVPRTRYDPRRFAPDGTVLFDVVREPPDAACHACHTTRTVGPGTPPRWQRDGDVHLRAGMSCADCHPNGLEHHTVRGHPGEPHPAGAAAVSTLTCRGCHGGLPGEADGAGRLGAPRARHRGLPPLHLEHLSCTACHSGPAPSARPHGAQTSMAHALGIPSQTRRDDDLPLVSGPVHRREADGVIRPVRLLWPAFWGWLGPGGDITPIPPAAARRTVRRGLRVRRDLRREHAGDADAFRAGLARTLGLFQRTREDGAVPVYVSGGRVHRLAADGESLETVAHAAAEPYAWPLAHDVRPARLATGARGCTDCHAAGAPFVHAVVAATGPAPGADHPASSARELMALPAGVTRAWEGAFTLRPAFTWAGIAAVLALLAGLLLLPAARAPRRRRAVTSAAWTLTALTAAVLAVTALYGAAAGARLAGWPLLAHVAAGGPFAALLAAAVLLAPDRRSRLMRALALLGLVSAGAVLAATLPLFGTAALEVLIDVHVWTGAAFTALLVVWLVRRRRRQRGVSHP